MNQSIDLNILVDQSSSMLDCKDATIEALNGFIIEQRKVPGSCTATMAYFSYPQDFNYVLKGEPIQTCRLLNKDNYKPMGSTALLDAVGRIIDDTGKRLAALPQDQRPDKILVVIITDGEENSSCTYSKQQVIEMVTHQRDVYKWEFVFLAADMDKIATEAAARGIGIHSNKMSYSKGATAQTISKISACTTAYRFSDINTCTDFCELDEKEEKKKKDVAQQSTAKGPSWLV